MDLKRAKALLEHYAETREGAEVIVEGEEPSFSVQLQVPVRMGLIFTLQYFHFKNGGTTCCVHGQVEGNCPDIVAMRGGCLIQLSNLMRQLRALED